MTFRAGNLPTRRPRRVLALCLALTALVLGGCSSVSMGRAYSPDELAWQCQRNGGVWRSFVGDGYCEIQSPGFL
jgi:hypothetical protein